MKKAIEVRVNLPETAEGLEALRWKKPTALCWRRHWKRWTPARRKSGRMLQA